MQKNLKLKKHEIKQSKAVHKTTSNHCVSFQFSARFEVENNELQVQHDTVNAG